MSRIDERAAEWVVRDDRGLTGDERRERDDWLAADERHLGAYVRATAMFMRTERAAALGPDFSGAVYDPATMASAAVGADEPFEDQPERRALSRRHFVRLSAAASVTAVLGAGIATWWISRGARFSTRLGEVHAVALSDGSTVTLNTRSSIRVAFTGQRRLIELEYGEALFDVAKDPARPFIVRGGEMDVTAVGTSFTVARDERRSTARVVVNEGVVEARRPDDNEHPLRLSANMAASAGPDEMLQSTSLTATDVQRELVWRQGLLQFDNATLTEAAADFARYSDIAIEVVDPELRSERISGSFMANDPVGFSRTAATIFNARAEIRANTVRLVR